MAVRVDREVFDPVAVTSAAGGGVTFVDDGSRTPPWQPRPYTTKEEYIVSEAMRLMSIPADEIRMIRPSFTLNSDPFPPVFGYDTTPLTIEEVLQTDRWTPKVRSWVSGGPSTPRRMDMQEDNWSGTLRGFSASPNPAG
jgi:hypothetical protein